MPLYEYECDNCGNRFEQIQSMRDESIKQCPKCSSDKLRKIFHPTGIIFKGSGWYINDSRKSSSSDKESSESKPTTETKTESKTEAKAKTETKTESKTETKTETKTESKKESSESK